MREIVKALKVQVVKDISFITEKMMILRERNKNSDFLDIKQMADFHRYSETRMFLVDTLKSLEGDDGEGD